MDKLLDYLKSLPAGPVSDTKRLEKLLSVCWEEFDGNNAENMAGYKLHDRMEEVEWEPPFLRFTIERHGATVMGSSRAELMDWNINVHEKTAVCAKGRYKQIKERKAPVYVKPIAAKVAQLIIKQKPDKRLKWNNDGTVRVLIGEIFPAGSAIAQTLQGRRKRFKLALEKHLNDAGWEKVGVNVYGPSID